TMSILFEPRARRGTRSRRRTRAAAHGALSEDFARTLRAVMHAHVAALGGVPLMYQVCGLSAEKEPGARVRVEGGPESCMVTALFPGVQVRAFSNSPGGWFSAVPTPGCTPDGTAVVCTSAGVSAHLRADAAASLLA